MENKKTVSHNLHPLTHEIFHTTARQKKSLIKIPAEQGLIIVFIFLKALEKRKENNFYFAHSLE